MRTKAVQPMKWKPPEPGTLKLSVDASIAKSDRFGVGFVVRDYTGFPIQAVVKWSMG